MKYWWGLLIIILIPVLLEPSYAFENTKHMKLLAVSQDKSGNLSGSLADLSVSVVPGYGRVLIETYPLTKVDTQISARLAKEIACKFLDADCSKFDFTYTIRSNSPTIGGPSAGAAISALTVAALDDLEVDPKMTVTGTISSGGLVGTVGGLYPKVEAAIEQGLTTILIPSGGAQAKDHKSNESNATINLIDYGLEHNVNVKEVYALSQVVEAMTGKTYEKASTVIEPPAYYTNIMSQLANELCDRAQGHKQKIDTVLLAKADILLGNNSNASMLLQKGNDLLNYSVLSSSQEQHYATASYCFGAGLQFNYLFWLSQDDKMVKNAIDEVFYGINDFILPDVKTITDLQTHMLVKERLREALTNLEDAKEALEKNQTIEARNYLSYGEERFYSAQSWSAFLNAPGEPFEESTLVLERACGLRLREARERQQYIQIYLPNSDIFNSEDLNAAIMFTAQGDYPMCIFYASKAKAYFDILFNALTNEDDTEVEHLDRIIETGRRQINKQFSNNVFPIAAFSYVEYAESLGASDTRSALLYAQYGIELSDIDIYINGGDTGTIAINNPNGYKPLHTFLAGMAFGMILFLILLQCERSIRTRQKKRKRS